MAIPADPFSSFMGSAGAGLGKGLADALGGGGPFVGGSSQAGAYGTTLDGAGWIVNIGGTQTATASPTRTQTEPTLAAAAAGVLPAAASVSSANGALLMLGAGLVLVMVIRNRRKGAAK